MGREGAAGHWLDPLERDVSLTITASLVTVMEGTSGAGGAEDGKFVN
jgi:hypothetical protein